MRGKSRPALLSLTSKPNQNVIDCCQIVYQLSLKTKRTQLSNLQRIPIENVESVKWLGGGHQVNQGSMKWVN